MNKTALITGGTRGIGLGIAKVLAHKGCDLALNGMRDESLVSDVIEDLRKTTGVTVNYYQRNLGSSDDRDKLIGKVIHDFGHLNFLVNNAGMAPRKRTDILEVAEHSYHEVMDVNLTGPYFLTQQAARHMIEMKEKDPDYTAVIINIGSISATLASINRGEYCLSKAGMSMMTQLFAVRLGEHDIPVYEIRPGVTATDMTAGVKEKYDKMIAEGLTLQKRWGLPEDIGKAVLSLVEGDLPYSTGQVIMVDGGLTVGRL